MTAEPPHEAPEQEPEVNAPEFTGGEWLQGGPVPVRGSGRPLLVDFWDYTCINCLRTLPYLAEWHRRYEPHGLTIVGVHTPEFDFARNADHVRSAIADLALPFPIVLDSQRAIWQAYANRYWPAQYFIDVRGKIRAQHYGEGAYEPSEQLLQTLLGEQEGFAAELPSIMEPLRAEDGPGAVCYRVTPELYCGYARGQLGNAGGPLPDQPHRYVDPGKHVEGALYLEGDWLVAAESAARPVGAKGPSRMTLTYMAADLNLVLHPPLAGGPGSLRVALDDAPLIRDGAGEDVVNGVVTVDRPRLYRIARGEDVDRHTLVLETESDGLAAFAFTFTSCVAPPPEDEGEPA